MADLKMYALDVEHLMVCMGTWQAVSTAKILMLAGAAAVKACMHKCCSQSLCVPQTERDTSQGSIGKILKMPRRCSCQSLYAPVAAINRCVCHTNEATQAMGTLSTCWH